MIQFSDVSFKTQALAKEYVRSLLQEIGICRSVKGKSYDYYDKLLAISQRHPDSDEKLENIIDFAIIPNKLNRRALELNIVKCDGSCIDISFHMYVTGKHKSNKSLLFEAFRYCIDSQISDFKQTADTSKCTLCGIQVYGDLHIDHEIHFQKLVEDFLQLNAFAIPTSFISTTDGSNRHIFKDEDAMIGRAFSEYHAMHAKLRVTCPTCNLSRKKY